MDLNMADKICVFEIPETLLDNIKKEKIIFANYSRIEDGLAALEKMLTPGESRLLI